jgi:hypothetical protein
MPLPFTPITSNNVSYGLPVIDIPNVLNAINDRTKVVAIQRSKGYDQRPSIPVDILANPPPGFLMSEPAIISAPTSVGSCSSTNSP